MPSLGSGRGQRRERHPSVQALLSAHPEEADPKRIMRRLAQEKVAYAKAKGWQGPPFEPRILTSVFGIRCKEVAHEIGSEGRLIRYPDGRPWIEYRSGRLPERQHFTLLHEFAHTFFPDFCDYLPLNDAPSENETVAEREFENLCDIAAAEMLMPAEDFRSDLCKVSCLGCEALLELARRYEASIDATTHRAVQLTDALGCAAVFVTDQKGVHGGYGPLWVKYCCCSPLFKGFISPGTTPPKNSVVFGCYRNGSSVSCVAKETWWIKGKPRTWLVQAARLPTVLDNPEYPKVVALLLPSSYRAAT
jgi:hypothetical protein